MATKKAKSPARKKTQSQNRRRKQNRNQNQNQNRRQRRNAMQKRNHEEIVVTGKKNRKARIPGRADSIEVVSYGSEDWAPGPPASRATRKVFPPRCGRIRKAWRNCWKKGSHSKRKWWLGWRMLRNQTNARCVPKKCRKTTCPRNIGSTISATFFRSCFRRSQCALG